jgi:hypothetical protein
VKIFISWSGEESRYVADALKNFIGDMFSDAVKAWISSSDIMPGVRWATELAGELANSQFGILCITRNNAKSSWILFEAGALAKQLEVARVVPYLIDMRPADLEFPLAQFQSVEANELGTRMLMQSISNAQVLPLAEGRFNRAFERWWPDFRQAIDNLPKAPGTADPVRTERDILGEILDISRSQYRTNLRPVASLAPDARSTRQGTQAVIYWHEEGLTFTAARNLADVLEKNGIQSVLAKHRDPNCPDSLFIGALVGAEDAQRVLANLPYKPKYIFHPDCPDSWGGDASGLTIGIGYMSSHPQSISDDTAKPILLSDDVLRELSDPGLSNTRFQAILRGLIATEQKPVRASPSERISSQSYRGDRDVGTKCVTPVMPPDAQVSPTPREGDNDDK